jgi:hypothetical protein
MAMEFILWREESEDVIESERNSNRPETGTEQKVTKATKCSVGRQRTDSECNCDGPETGEEQKVTKINTC